MKVCKKRKRASNKTETETEDEPLNAKFRRGEIPSEVENLMLTSDDDNTRDQEEEWMTEALMNAMDDNSQD